MKKIKAVAYARVSTLLNQDPDTQLINIREFCKARGFELVNEYVDKGISGAREKRPALDQMVSDARKGKFQILICTGIDRLGRSTKHLLNLFDELKHFGVNFISIREQIEFGSPSGQLALAMISAVAQLERQLISERIRTSLAAKKLASQSRGTHWRCGRPVLATPEITRKVVELHSRGLSVRQIEKALHKVISRGTVQRILKRQRE